MKEATGELNMTVVTIVLIGVIAAFFAFFWPTSQERIENSWNGNATAQREIKDEVGK